MNDLTPTPAGSLAGPLSIGEVANQVASRHTFTRYRERKAANTRRRHDADLSLFAEYLASVGAVMASSPSAPPKRRPGHFVRGEMASDPGAWQGVTWGLVEAFKPWLLAAGYSIASVNAALSTVKSYADLAAKAGAIDPNEARLIASIKGFSHGEGLNIDKQRHPARIGPKKAAWVILTTGQAKALKSQPDTPQGRRDALLMCLLLDHGLRCGEVAGLQVSDFDLKAGELRFYRPKVDLTQTHRLTPDALRAARAYFKLDALAVGPLLRGSRKGGQLHEAGCSKQAITARVKTLGLGLDIPNLSAHDCRHYWASLAAKNRTPVDRLKQAGGWSSSAMALRYVSEAAIANEGVNLDTL